ncbi:MAG: PLP-dependent aminotransferase family protein [Anaeromyxobacter sp.]
MSLQITLGRGGRLGSDLYQQLRQRILDGRLPAGARLPASRALARALRVSRNTVLGAYGRLGAEGFLGGRVGAGTFVADGVRAAPSRAPSGRRLRPLPRWAALADPPAPIAPAPFDFRVGAPDPRLFPWDTWRRALARELRGRRPAPGYAPPEGEERLRAAIARHLAASRGVHAGAEDVLLCAGAQHAFDLVARILVEPGTCVAVEDPGYPPARQVLEAQGARVVPVPVDGEGLVVAALPADAQLVVVTPSHQFPLGVPMSLARRQALLEWSRRRGAAILEDDYDAEFRHDGRPLEALQGLDRHGRVLYVGTFSKLLLPTLRLGYVVAPASLMGALRAARRLSDSHGPPEPQRALATLIEEGLFSRHLRKLHRIYRDRRDRLVTALERELGEVLELFPGAAGLHLAARCRDERLDVPAWIARARQAGVAVEGLQGYAVRRRVTGLAIGFGLIEAARVDEGVARLAAAGGAPRAGALSAASP